MQTISPADQLPGHLPTGRLLVLVHQLLIRQDEGHHPFLATLCLMDLVRRRPRPDPAAC